MRSESKVNYGWPRGEEFVPTTQLLVRESVEHGNDTRTIAASSNDNFASRKYGVEIFVDRFVFAPCTAEPLNLNQPATAKFPQALVESRQLHIFTSQREWREQKEVPGRPDSTLRKTALN